VSARAAQVVAKRRTVVVDMASTLLTEFSRGLDTDPDWAALGPSALEHARGHLEHVLMPLHTQEPEHYNDDAQLGAAINSAVFFSKTIRGWGKSAAALASLSGHTTVALLELESLVLKECEITDIVFGGIYMLLISRTLRVLELERSELGAAGAARLALGLGRSHLRELRCARLPRI
jgi:hypothetical protein